MEIIPHDFLEHIRTQPCHFSGRDAIPHHTFKIGRVSKRSDKMNPRHLTTLPVAPVLHLPLLHENPDSQAYRRQYEIALMYLVPWLSGLLEEDYWKHVLRMVVMDITGERI